ncbi:hypothetical protein [Pseudoroseicyclus aestuarii]|uniref:Uncharacterized protein n=1 Tax=Pseudoroseicyclus aestuarii TaxID=1795041 RepID=A0A318T8R3_9RHOB|nr:hypothetical protein [Pseudoroseicyclus aestuarii]PYE84768.1 hypothetical protein DFP88_102571 [Pseudoroseicyclus aestuarii]
MEHRWILEVLADLETYAACNDLPRLAAEIAGASATAQREIGLPLQEAGRAPPQGALPPRE